GGPAGAAGACDPTRRGRLREGRAGVSRQARDDRRDRLAQRGAAAPRCGGQPGERGALSARIPPLRGQRADAVQRDRGLRPAVEARAGRHGGRLLGHLRRAGAAEVRDAGAGGGDPALVAGLAGRRDRRGERRRGWTALGLAGFASGCALAWQWRQMVYACRDDWEWTVSIVACFAALFTALRLVIWLAGRVAGAPYKPAPAGRLRFAWLFLLALYGLLLVFDGRYRDFPLGLFALPCVGYVLTAWLDDRVRTPYREALFLAAWLPLLAAVVVALELGENPSTWLWLVLNLAIAVPVLQAAWQARATRARTGDMLG